MFLYMLLNTDTTETRDTMEFNNIKQNLKDEICSFQFWKAVRCEFLISLLYMFFGCGTLTMWDTTQPVNDIKVSLTFGFASATLSQCVGQISGAHMNPAVTIAMLVTRKISVLRSVFYIFAQGIGAIAGAGILYGVTPHAIRGTLGVTQIHPDMALGQAFGVEFMITFVVVFTVFANMESKRIDMGSRSVAIGLAVMVGHLFALKSTGAGLNPARCLGPAVVMNIWTNHWMYWLGPILGGIMGGFTYEYTQDSSNRLQNLQHSFKQRPTTLKRSRSVLSNNSFSTEMTLSQTEMTPSQTDDDLRI